MAFGAKKIFPVDLTPGTAVGVALPFNAPAVFRSTYTTKDAIKNNLINFFLTNKTERYLNPTFGGNLRTFVFQQITEGNLEGLQTNIENSLSLYFPNVVVEEFTIVPNEDENEVKINLTYSIQNTGINDAIEIQFT
jgi:phage baseplate assembly protein W